VIYDEAPATDVIIEIPSDLDALIVPPMDDPQFKVQQAGMTFFENDHDGYFLSVGHTRQEAGDLFPTIVTPQDAKNYIGQVDAGYTQLDNAVQASAVPLPFKTNWTVQLASWKAFSVTATAAVGWLNTTAVMSQTDSFNSQLNDWRKQFQAQGGTPPPSPITPPGLGTPGTGATNAIQSATGAILAVAAVAAIVVFGPSLTRFFR
jgi:hypothetical protein